MKTVRHLAKRSKFYVAIDNRQNGDTDLWVKGKNMRTGMYPLIMIYPQETPKTTMRVHGFLSIQYDIQNNYSVVSPDRATEFTMFENVDVRLNGRRAIIADGCT